MLRDNEQKEMFRKWKDTEVTGWDGVGEPAKARFSMGLIVATNGVFMIAEGHSGDQHGHALSETEELSLLEALRVRFDQRHRTAVEQQALAKLTGLEQDVLRQKWRT